MAGTLAESGPDAPAAGGSDAATEATTQPSPPATPEPGLESETQPLGREEPGRYRLLKELARGGQGVVHVAWDAHLGREVAFKQLLDRQPVQASPNLLTPAEARFVREARITAQLDHPGIAPLFEVGRRADGALYATQRLVRGRTLAAALAACRTPRDRFALLRPLLSVCQAVAYAHGRGVIHRDLKPGNLMLADQGEPVVLDWGLGRTGQESLADASPPVDSLLNSDAGRTREGALIGTPAYMSPEQALGLTSVDARSDVWSLGVILFEVLAGRRPFGGASTQEVLKAVVADQRPPVRELCPEAPPELVAVVDRALSRNPSQRYASAAEVARELEAWLSGGKVGAYRYPASRRLSRWVARHAARSLAALALVLAAVVALLIWRLAPLRTAPPVTAMAARDAQAIDQQALWLLGSGIDKVQAGDVAGGAADLRTCIALQPSRELKGKCLKNLGITSARAGDSRAAAVMLRRYLSFCDSDCDAIRTAITRFGGEPTPPVPVFHHEKLPPGQPAQEPATLLVRIDSEAGVKEALGLVREKGSASPAKAIPLTPRGGAHALVIPASMARGTLEYSFSTTDEDGRQAIGGDGDAKVWFQISFTEALGLLWINPGANVPFSWNGRAMGKAVGSQRLALQETGEIGIGDAGSPLRVKLVYRIEKDELLLDVASAPAALVSLDGVKQGLSPVRGLRVGGRGVPARLALQRPEEDPDLDISLRFRLKPGPDEPAAAIEHVKPRAGLPEGQEVTLRVQIHSAVAIREALAFVRPALTTGYKAKLPLRHLGDSAWSVTLPAEVAHGQVEYFFVAADDEGRRIAGGDGDDKTWFKIGFVPPGPGPGAAPP